jgi:hypothetical protein
MILPYRTTQPASILRTAAIMGNTVRVLQLVAYPFLRTVREATPGVCHFAERPRSAAAAALRDLKLRETYIAAAVCCSGWFGTSPFCEEV